jgi:hypothetical protein
MTRAASLLLRVLGLTLVLVGLMGFVLLGVDGTWTARAEIPAGRTAVVLEPSVVSVLGTNVTVRIEPSVGDDRDQVAAGIAPPAGYFLGRGRADDITAYAQDPAVTRVVGLARSRQLEVRDGPGPVSPLTPAGVPSSSPSSPSTPSAVPPTTVDLWQQQVSGPRARQLTWRPTPGARSVLVAREDGTPLPALGVEVAWTNHTWLWMPTVALVLGLVLIVAGLVLGDALPSPAMLVRPSTRGTTRRGAVSGEAGQDVADVPPAAGPPEPVAPAAPSGPEPVLAAADPSSTVIAATRRAARGRRRKQTVWDKVRSRAQSERRPSVGGKRDRA